MKLNLVLFPSPILKKTCNKVNVFDDQLRKTAQEMIALMKAEKGLGLAGPQVGILKRIIIVSSHEVSPIALCNPVVLESSGSQTGLEGCLSFPDLFKEVTRPQTVKIRYQDLRGGFHTETVEGLLARCVLHEMDHLDGILFTELSAVNSKEDLTV